MQWSELSLRVRRAFGRVSQSSRITLKKKVALRSSELVMLGRAGAGRSAADTPRSRKECRGRITTGFNNGNLPSAVVLSVARMSNVDNQLRLQREDLS